MYDVLDGSGEQVLWDSLKTVINPEQQTVPLTSGIRLTQKNLIHLLLNTQRRHNSFKIKTRQDAFLFTGTYPAWFF